MSEEKGKGVKIDIEKGSGGINIQPAPGEIKPPLEDQFKAEEERGTEGEEEEITRSVPDKIPISAAIIKPPLRLEGNVLAEITGYQGWIYSEEDLQEITDLFQQCGIMLSPQIQVVIAMATIHGAKFTAYLAWKKRGRPNDLRKQTGEAEKPKVPPGEETIA